MTIHYLTIEEERTEDAPFIGALISATGCSIGCKKCFNQHLRKLPIQKRDVISLINEIKKNPFNKGIILGGLEWSDQAEELYDLVKEALRKNLKVMIYTGLDIQDFLHKVPRLQNLKGDIYLKYGHYNPCFSSRISHNVKLSSNNQKIAYFEKSS